jgi:MoaA/NifB/PqqE/SkfB family radical SAM enzyme
MQKQADKSKIPPYRVFLNWEIHHACNYKCRYCPPSKHEEYGKEAYQPFEKLVEGWETVYKKYGCAHIQINGGEPSVYPDFFKLIEIISKMHTIEIITNLSFDLENVLNRIPSKRLRIGASFHPEFSDFSKFFNKMKILKNEGYPLWVNYVAYPENLEKMGYYEAEFLKEGINFTILPYNGMYKDRMYPKNYTAEELKLLKKSYDAGGETGEDNRSILDWKTNAASAAEKKICRMGQMYAKIYPSGEVYRCCGKKSLSLGNIFKNTFELLDEALQCENDECLCWRCMLINEESRWIKQWNAIDI